MKKVLLSAVMCFALATFTSTAFAQDTKGTCKEKTECTKNKKDCPKDKKECDKNKSKSTKDKKECTKGADKKACCSKK